MTLSSSLNAGVAGLAANSSRLGGISDNIANSQTAGYKRVETQFASLVVSEGGGRYAAGGVSSASFRQVDARGGLVTSDNPTDLAIGGRGLLPVAPVASLDGGGPLPVRYLPTGSFRPDEAGVLRTASGLALLGWPADRDGTVPAFPRDSTNALVPVTVTNGSLLASPTDLVTLGVNLPAAETQAGAAGDPLPLSVEYFDNLGARQSLDFVFTPVVPGTGASNQWTVTVGDSQTDPASNPIASFTVTFDATAAGGGSIATVTGATGGAYDAATGLFSLTTGGGALDLQIGRPGGAGGTGGLTQFAAGFGPTGVSKNGAPAGALISVEVDENGFVQGVFEGGFVRTLYQVPLADFPNLNGLRALDGGAFAASADSGGLYLWNAGDGPTGVVVAHAVEGSSADIAAELTSLITTQRAYSSNATVIRTVDEMLQETTNLKR